MKKKFHGVVMNDKFKVGLSQQPNCMCLPTIKPMRLMRNYYNFSNKHIFHFFFLYFKFIKKFLFADMGG